MTPTDRSETLPEKVGAQAWLTQHAEEDRSLEALKQYRVVPVLRLIQGLSNKELKAQHGEGATLLMPGAQPFAGPEVFVDVVPLFMFTEFRKYSDRKDTESPMIPERSHDPRSGLAELARDADKRKEVYEGDEKKPADKQRFWRYTEALCFLCTVYAKGHPQRGTVFTMEFMKGSFWAGKNFSSGCLSRKIEGSNVPLYYQVWQIGSGVTSNRDGDEYWILNFRNPDGSEDHPLYVEEAEAAAYQQMHKELQDDYDNAKIVVDSVDMDDHDSDDGDDEGM